MPNPGSRRAIPSSSAHWMLVLALAAGLCACSEQPTEQAHEPAAEAQVARPEDPYSQLIAAFDGSGRTGVEAARNADRAALLLFSASW